jgi:hypothetical protein
MTDRTALLIGVPACDNDLFAPIGAVVAADIRRMTDALAQSGYRIRHCGVGDPAGHEPTGNRIRAAILTALREAPRRDWCCSWSTRAATTCPSRWPPWLAPARSPTLPTVRVQSAQGQFCGQLSHLGDGILRVSSSTGYHLIPLTSVVRIDTVTSCAP